MLMSNKNKLFFKFDILSNPPSLRIFGNYNYKTTWSANISILVIALSAAFVSYSFHRFFKFRDPNLYYWKDSAYEKDLSTKLNETLLMFKIAGSYRKNEIFLKAYIYDFDYNTSYEYMMYEVSLEKCELGNNIDLKFEKLIKQYKDKHLGKSIHDFYCINRKDAEKYSLSYNKNDGYNYLSIFLYSKNDTYNSIDDLRLYLVMESDFVNHSSKYNPIDINYIETYSSYFDQKIIEITNFNLDYIEYDSNDGIFLDSINSYHGIRLNGQNQELYIRKEIDINTIGGVKIQINRNTFDKFNRIYSKLPYLLAEMESICYLMYIIGGILANIVSRKKMSFDLSRIIMNKKTEINKGDFDLYKRNPTFNEIFGDIEDIRNPKNRFKGNTNSSEKYQYSMKTSFSSRNIEISKNILNKNKNNNNINSNNININSNNINTKDNKNKDVKKLIKESILKNIDINLMNEIEMKKINVSTIIKSYCHCLKNKKTELINLCHDFILSELSIDRILIRLFKLEKIYDLLSDKDKAQIHFMQIKELEEINEYLNKRFRTNTEEKEIIKSLDNISTSEEKNKN